jgi:hypothetical protein
MAVGDDDSFVAVEGRCSVKSDCDREFSNLPSWKRGGRLGFGGSSDAASAFFLNNMVVVAAVMTSTDAASVMTATAAFALDEEEVSRGIGVVILRIVRPLKLPCFGARQMTRISRAYGKAGEVGRLLHAIWWVTISTI